MRHLTLKNKKPVLSKNLTRIQIKFYIQIDELKVFFFFKLNDNLKSSLHTMSLRVKFVIL